MQYNALNRQGYGLTGGWRRNPQPMATLQTNTSMAPIGETLEATTDATTEVPGVDYAEIDETAPVLGGEGEVAPGADPSAPESAFEQHVMDDAVGGFKSMAGKSAMNAGLSTAMGAPIGAAVGASIPGPMSVGLGMVDMASKGYAGQRVSDVYGDMIDDPDLSASQEVEMNAAIDDAVSGYEDPTEIFSPQEMTDWDQTQQAKAKYDDLTENIAKPFYGEIVAPTPTQTVGGRMGFGDGLRGAVEGGPSATSGNAPSMAGGYGYGGMGSGGWTPSTYGNFARELEASSASEAEAMAGGMNEDFGDFSEAGEPFGGQVGDLDSSWRKGGMITDRDKIMGEELNAKVHEGEYVLTPEMVQQLQRGGKLDDLERWRKRSNMGLRGPQRMR